MGDCDNLDNLVSLATLDGDLVSKGESIGDWPVYPLSTDPCNMSRINTTVLYYIILIILHSVIISTTQTVTKNIYQTQLIKLIAGITFHYCLKIKL